MKTIICSAMLLVAIQVSAQNVGIGTTNTTLARLTVTGGVNGQVALFQSTSGISIDGGSSPSVGFNYNSGKAISTGAGGKLELTPSAYGGFNLDYYSSVAAGATFTTTSNIFKYRDNRGLGFGQWFDLLYTTDRARLNVANEMYNKQNGSLSLLPIGAIYFKVTGFQNGSNATKVITNVGGGSIYDNVYSFHVEQGGSLGTDGYMQLVLNLDLTTKDYEGIYVVGAPSFYNSQEETQSSQVEFLRAAGTTKDRLQIWYGASGLSGLTEVYGTLLIYGTRIN